MKNYNTKEVYNDKDYVWKWDIIETPSLNFKKAWEIQYHQHWNTCFLYWPMWAVSDLTWYEFVKEAQEDLVVEAWASKYADPKWWWYFWYWIKSVCDLYNERYAENSQWLEYYRVPKKDWEEWLDRWYSIVIWYKHSKEWVNDKRDDWIINKSNTEYDWTEDWYWHCTRLIKYDWKYYIVNNYSWTSQNIFEIDNYKDNTSLFAFWYIPVLLEDVKDWYQWLSLEEKEEKLKNRKEVLAKRKELEYNKSNK